MACLLILSGYSLLRAYTTAHTARVAVCAEEELRTLDLRVDEVMANAGRMTRIAATVLEEHSVPCTDLAGARLRLNWYRAPDNLSAAQVWRVSARVREPWGFQNPGGFDYERWLVANGFSGTGYVRHGQLRWREDASLRERTSARIMRAIEASGAARPGALAAIVVGHSGAVDRETWQLLRTTGTVHLFVVSGLHISLVMGLGVLGGRLASRIFLISGLPPGRPRLPVACSLASGAVYAWLAGGSVPTIRAYFMAVAVTLVWVAGRRLAPWPVFLLAITMVVGAMPLSVFTQGFYLSFAAVAVLVTFFSGLWPRPRWFTGLLLAQLALWIGMTPWVAAWVGEVPVGSGVANLVAVPVVSLVVVPAALLGAAVLPVDTWAAHTLLWVAGMVLDVLLDILRVLQGVHIAHVGPGMLAFTGSTTAAALVLARPQPFLLLLLAPLWLLWLLPGQLMPGPGEVRVTALDVGQGSAVLVDTHKHRLVYDTGARYASGFDLGEAVVVPALAATGSRQVDALLISHGDNDHAGGAGAIRDRLPVARTLVHEDCRAGLSWTWDGVKFSVVYPGRAVRASGNNQLSCVLAVDAPGGRTLLTGDIDRSVEIAILDVLPAGIDVLLVPHHGSRSSSSVPFIAHTKPRFALISAGRGNAYGHPHATVVERYLKRGSAVCVTAQRGALQWYSRQPQRIRSWRNELPTFLNGAPGGEEGCSKTVSVRQVPLD